MRGMIALFSYLLLSFFLSGCSSDTDYAIPQDSSPNNKLFMVERSQISDKVWLNLEAGHELFVTMNPDLHEFTHSKSGLKKSFNNEDLFLAKAMVHEVLDDHISVSADKNFILFFSIMNVDKYFNKDVLILSDKQEILDKTSEMIRNGFILLPREIGSS